MEEFIVLGIIPGTEYQTTFAFWAVVSAVIAAIPALVSLWRRRYALIGFGLSLYITWQISRHRLLA